MEKKRYETFWELATTKLFGETDSREDNQLDLMLQEDQLHKEFDQMQNIHRKLLETKPLLKLSADRSWKRVTTNLHFKALKIYWVVFKYAAIILFALYIGTLIHPKEKPDLVSETEIVVPLGQMSTVTLFDGTSVWLNSGTTLRYSRSFGKSDRSLFLDGEAFFHVKKGDFPFLVNFKNNQVEVSGTRFNVIAFEDEDYSQVTLIDGSLTVHAHAGREMKVLEPSQQITLTDDPEGVILKKVDVRFYQSWTDGKIVFHEERLSDIVQRLERWYNVDIVLSNPEIGEMRFSGTILKNKPFDQIAKAFEILLPIRINYQNKIDHQDKVTISKK